MTDVLVYGLVALAVSSLCAPLVLVLLRRGGLFDHPSERSSHATAVPRGGGVAPAVGALTALALAASSIGDMRWKVVVATGLFGVIGLIEDVVGIRPLHRLGVQFVAAVVAGLFVVDNVSGPLLWRGVFMVSALFWLVAFVNAYNFMDGIDGISVVQAVGAGATWALVGTYTDVPVLAATGGIVLGAALGFAPYNLPRARMFLGDVGSYFIGAWLGVVAILALRAGLAPEAVLAPLALYGADTGMTLLRRVTRGERWYLPHRDHVYQRLTDAGWSHVRVSAFVAACIGTCGALGALSLGNVVWARVMADAAIVGVVCGYLLSPGWLARRDSPVAVV